MQKWNPARFSSQWCLRSLEEVWRYRLPLSSPEVQPLFSEEQGTRQEGVKDHHGDNFIEATTMERTFTGEDHLKEKEENLEFQRKASKQCQPKKNVQCESCKLSFIWGEMKTVAQETTPQWLCESAPKRQRGMVSIYVIFGEGGIYAIKHTFSQKVSTSLRKPQLVTIKQSLP